MNSRKRVLTALKWTGTRDKKPFEISWGAFTPGLMKTFRKKTGTDLSPEEYFDFNTRFVLPSPTKKEIGFSQYFNEFLPENISFDEWGIGSVPTRYEIPDYKLLNFICFCEFAPCYT